MAGNDWWQAPKDAKSSRSAKTPYFEFPRTSTNQPSAAVENPGGAPLASTSVYEPPFRQASKASRQGSAPIVELSQDAAGASTKPVRILRRPKQADTTSSSSGTQQGSAVPLFKGHVNVRGSPTSDISPQGQPVNRKERRAHMQWRSPSSVAQVLSCTPVLLLLGNHCSPCTSPPFNMDFACMHAVKSTKEEALNWQNCMSRTSLIELHVQEDALLMSSSAPPSFMRHGRKGGPVPSPIGSALGGHPLSATPLILPSLKSEGTLHIFCCFQGSLPIRMLNTCGGLSQVFDAPLQWTWRRRCSCMERMHGVVPCSCTTSNVKSLAKFPPELPWVPVTCQFWVGRAHKWLITGM